jgi:hypothetical protein
LVANGKTTEEIIEDYPYLEPEDIRQSLLYAAWLTQEKVIPLATPQKIEAYRSYASREGENYRSCR